MDVPVARAVINIIVGSLLKNLISILKKEFSLIKGVEKDVEKLISILSTIQAVLEDAEEKQIKNKPILVWLRKLKDATSDAEDTWALKIQQHNQKEAVNIVSRSLPSSLNPKKIRFGKIAKQFQKVISTFDEIAGQQKFHLSTGGVLHQDDVSICPIVGMGGLGKTTLGQSVYNDERVKRHFELRKWVCVFEPFDVKRVLDAIIGTSIPGTLKAVHLVGDIQRQKRYLQRSSVVLTTPCLTVESITGAQPYRLGALSDDDCFSLFKNHVLGDGGEEQHPKLGTIGMQIAKKCKGVLLVAKSLGSFLRFRTEEKLWESVRDSGVGRSRRGCFQ